MSIEKKRTKYRYKNRRKAKAYWLSGIVLLVAAGSAWFYQKYLIPEVAAVWFEAKVPNSSKVSLPQDDAPHDAKIEWWYYNGHLISESGRKYSFHDTTFLVNGVTSFMVNHVSFLDQQTGRHYTDQRRSGGNLSAGSNNRFQFEAGNWYMAGSNGVDSLRAKAAEFAFDLQLTSSQSPVFHGEDGIISLDRAGSSYYYSRPRMAIFGEVEVDGRREKVTGLAWFDHQWGDFSTTELSWDWFSLQLDNDSDIMIYQLRDKADKPVLYTGSFTENNVTEILTDKEFSLDIIDEWQSTRTGISYPVAWKITVPKKNIAITTREVADDCEFDAKLTTYNIYWEGAIQISGTHTGKGFMELSGYSAKNKINLQ